MDLVFVNEPNAKNYTYKNFILRSFSADLIFAAMHFHTNVILAQGNFSRLKSTHGIFDCSKYEYVDREVFLLSWMPWQEYMVNCPYQYTFKSHIKACSQQRGDEDTASLQSRSEAQQKWGSFEKYSAEERKMVKNNGCPPLNFFDKYSIVWETGYQLSKLARSDWQFSSYLMLEFHISLYEDVP